MWGRAKGMVSGSSGCPGALPRTQRSHKLKPRFWILPPSHKLGFPGGSEITASAYYAREPGLIPGLGISPGEGNGNPLQYS